MAKRRGIGIVAFLWALGWGLTNIAFSEERILIALDFIPLGQHAAMFAAQEKGYYQKVGISPQIERGAGSGDTIKRLAAGSVHFGLADLGALVVARSQGLQVKMLGVYYAKAPYLIHALKGSGITTPKDLEGRSIGMQPGNAVYVIFPAFASINKVNATQVTWVNMPPGSLPPALMAGTIDAMIGFATAEPAVLALAAKQGKELVTLYYADWGLDIYSNGMIARDESIQKQEDLVRRFVDSTVRAHAWAAENPEAAADIFVRLHPQANRELATKQWMKTVELMISPEARQFGLGYMTRDKVKLTRDIITKAQKLPVEVPVEDLYTLRFLPKVFVQK
jgi:NitT/TauT family transport system substrate-binding protein